MTNAEALRRALAAVRKGYADSNNFEGGSMASDECMNVIKDALRAEFKTRERQ